MKSLLIVALLSQNPLLPSAPTLPTLPLQLPPILPSTDLNMQLYQMQLQLQQCLAGIQQVDKNVSDGRRENLLFYSEVKSVWAQVGGPILKFVMPAVVAFLAGLKIK